MKKLNCWEFMKCGRGRASEADDADNGACRAAREKAMDGIHGGMNAGRACWAVAGKTGNESGHCGCGNYCFKKCNFYVKVRIEEGLNFRTPLFLAHMRGHTDGRNTF